VDSEHAGEQHLVRDRQRGADQRSAEGDAAGLDESLCRAALDPAGYAFAKFCNLNRTGTWKRTGWSRRTQPFDMSNNASGPRHVRFLPA